MKDILVIIRRNLLSPIVIAILVLASILLFLGEQRDALFISGVIAINTILAIVQEVRAERELKKLELMSAPRARRIKKNGKIEEVMFDQLLVGDTINLQIGDEVPADGKIISSSGLEADESILTGESAPVEKPVRSIVYAASAIVAGSAVLLVTAVGINTRVGAMTATLRRYNPQMTATQHAISHAITWLTYGALALAVLIYIIYTVNGFNAVQIFTTITASAVTFVFNTATTSPIGLIIVSHSVNYGLWSQTLASAIHINIAIF